MPQQGRLADPSLAAENQHATLTCSHSGNESFQRVSLGDTIDQPG
jgi:hypothetical protein